VVIPSGSSSAKFVPAREGASSGSWTMARISWLGAILKRGSMRFSVQSINPKRSTIS
jgi:hypothetical protein